mgnify:FL=1
MGYTNIVNDATDLRNRIRFLTGIQRAEISDDDLDIAINIAVEWFEDQTGLTYNVASSDAAHDNAVMYYSCYLASIASNGMGIEQIRIGDVFVQYDDEEPYNKFLDMANDALVAKLSLSIKTSTYNADPDQGDVNWHKNIDGSDGTLNIRKKPRGL